MRSKIRRFFPRPIGACWSFSTCIKMLRSTIQLIHRLTVPPTGTERALAKKRCVASWTTSSAAVPEGTRRQQLRRCVLAILHLQHGRSVRTGSDLSDALPGLRSYFLEIVRTVPAENSKNIQVTAADCRANRTTLVQQQARSAQLRQDFETKHVLISEHTSGRNGVATRRKPI